MRDIVRGWQKVPRGWKTFVVLALTGWAVELLFGFTGVLALLLCLFLAGLTYAALNPARGRKVCLFAVDQIAGQVADLVSLPLLLPIALNWWDVGRSGNTDRLASAIGYTALFVGVRWFLPYAIATAFEPGAWSGGKKKRRSARRTR